MASIVYANIWGIPNIYVKKDGTRFVDEGTYYVLVCEAMITNKATTAYCILDSTSVKKALEIAETGKARGITPEMTIAIGLNPNNIDKQAAAGDLWKADTIAELATKMGLDTAAVEKSIAFYNKDAEAGKDTQFGRKKALAPLKTPALLWLHRPRGHDRPRRRAQHQHQGPGTQRLRRGHPAAVRGGSRRHRRFRRKVPRQRHGHLRLDRLRPSGRKVRRDRESLEIDKALFLRASGGPQEELSPDGTVGAGPDLH